MKSDDDREEKLFREASQCAVGTERNSFLDQACVGDRALRQRLEDLLQAHENPHAAFDLISRVAPGSTQRLDQAIEEGPGTRIGRYKLLQKIGEGGMGVVYMAEQDEPVRRRVALKIIKLGMDTKQVIARFEAERQALALMDHPNIARVFDGGATETGRPYFVMELVQGLPITSFCDQNYLSARERLELFIPVCQAIQSAHQKGIIHRDIKPSNVMVTLQHGLPWPMVIDFGIAKATSQKQTEKTFFTQYATLIGTPAYMSPEQADISGLDVDTRSDLYSLGVLLYELLTGTTPFPEHRLRSMGYGEMQRVIVQEEPERPSTRLTTMDREQKTEVMKNRDEKAETLHQLLTGDLDWIVMKCLEKDRRRRYESASGLAGDIQRHLANEPVSARPPSMAYRWSKIIRRNKGAFAIASVIIAIIIIGSATSIWQAIRATQAQKRAETSHRTARQNAYAAEMSVALQSWREGDLGRALDLVSRQKPITGEEDLRGFEWRYLWHLCQDEAVTVIQGQGGVESLVFSPDGNVLVQSATTNLIVRNSSDFQIIRSLPGGADKLTFSVDGKLLAAADENQVRVYNTTSWQEVRTLPGKIVAQFSPDGSALLTADEGGFSLWDSRSWLPLAKWPGTSALLWHRRDGIAFSPDSQFVALPIVEQGLKGLWFEVWNLRTMQRLPGFEHQAEFAGSASFDPSGKHLLTGMFEGTVLVWDFPQGKVAQILKQHSARISSITFGAKTNVFATASSDRTVSFWDADAFQHLRQFRGHVDEVWSLCIAPDGSRAVSGGLDGTLRSWNRTASPLNGTFKGSGVIAGFSSDSKTLVGVTARGLKLFRLDTGIAKDIDIPWKTDWFFPFDVHLVSIADTNPIVALGRGDGVLEIWDLGSGRLVNSWQNGSNGVVATALGVDGKLVAAASVSGDVSIWNPTTHQRISRISLPPINSPCLAFSPDSQRLVVGGWSGNIHMIDVLTGKEVRNFIPSGQVYDLGFSPDGRMLAAATTASSRICLWDLAIKADPLFLNAHVEGISAVAFCPDSKTLISGGMDRKIRLWTIANRQEVVTLSVPGYFLSMRISPDGRTLAAGFAEDSPDPAGQILTWTASSFEEIEKKELSRQ